MTIPGSIVWINRSARPTNLSVTVDYQKTNATEKCCAMNNLSENIFYIWKK